MADKSQEILLQKMFVGHYIDNIPKDAKKDVLYVMKGDGIWQVRSNKLGKFFIHQVSTKIPGLESNFEEGWELNVPLIPSSLLKQAVSFFKSIYSKHKSEVHIQFFYDLENEEYFINCPKQKVSRASVTYINDKELETPNYILVLDMHSHGGMGAFFSATDDADEKDDRFFAVVGNITRHYPEIKLRLSVGGKKIEIDIEDIFDLQNEWNEVFPKEWENKIEEEVLIFKGFKKRHSSFEKSMRYALEDPDPYEVSKFLDKGHLYSPADYVPENVYQNEGDWFTDGKSWFYRDAEGNIHEDTDDDDDLDPIEWRRGRF